MPDVSECIFSSCSDKKSIMLTECGTKEQALRAVHDLM